MSQIQLTTVQIIAISILPLLFAITVHEVAHGYMAYLLGDKTARILGRLTLNPAKHIDVFGTIVVPLILLSLGGVIIGWAKPVPINSRNLNRPRRDLALIAAAGPLANLVMAFFWAGIAKIAMLFLTPDFSGFLAIYMMAGVGISINIMLLVLNLLPIPPLDGGHIIASLLPPSIAFYYERFDQRIVFLVLLILISLGIVNFVMRPVVNFLAAVINIMFGLSF